MLRRLLPLIALIAAAPCGAATAYKCVDAHGAISFQDHPCRTGAKQQTIALPDAPAAATGDTPPADPSPPQPVEPVVQRPSPPPIPPPAFYLCTRQDGSRYISNTGQPGNTAVPLGVQGVPGKSLADAYSGPNGVGVSAPGLRQIPHEPASSAPLANAYVWTQDQCHFAAPREACAYLRGELDDVNSKLKRAFSDTQAQLKQQQASIAQRMRGC